MAYTSRDEMTTAVETCVQAAIDNDSDDVPYVESPPHIVRVQLTPHPC
jgi:hypothetical protein